ncbi:hypothetical protein BpHYR1_006165, partial [Brachionus plicatilis]
MSHLMNICTVVNGLYCPNLSRSKIVQYYEIIVVDFLGGIFKTSSNFLCFFISCERYKTLKNNHVNLVFRNSRKIQNYSVAFLVFFLSVAINIERPLTSAINQFDFDEFDETSIRYPDYPIRNSFEGIFDPDLPFVTAGLNLKEKNP